MEALNMYGRDESGQVVLTGVESYSPWSDDLVDIRNLNEVLDDIQFQLNVEAAKSGLAALALLAIALAIATFVKFEKMAWSVKNWNRRDRRRFRALTVASLNQQRGILTELLKKPELSEEHRAKVTGSLKAMTELRDHLIKVTTQWSMTDTSDQRSAAKQEVDPQAVEIYRRLEDPLVDDNEEMADLKDLIQPQQKII